MKTLYIFSLAFGFLFSGCSRKTIPQGHTSKVSDGNGSVVSFLSYNIHHANPPSKAGVIDVNAIAGVINQQKVDIVALQEVDVNTTRSGVSLNEAVEIARLTGMNVFFAKAIDYAGGEYGVAILSKFPMEDKSNTPLPTDEATKGEHRTLATATIVLPDHKKFMFACTHLDAQGADINRQLQIKKILEVVKQESLPVVIAGDFNSLPGSDVIKQLDSYFTRSCMLNCPFTIPETSPNRTIDYIAFAPVSKFSVVSHSVIAESYASDHRPVKAVLQIQ